jgi:phosphorylcholine metabolism protein LicD
MVMGIIYYTVMFICLALVILVVHHLTRSETLEKFIDVQPSDKQSTYRHILLKTKEALDELDIPFFLSSGTCLGYFRERNFIEHDYDIDIGIHTKDYTPKLIDAMREKGLYLYRVLGSLKTGMELSFYLPHTPRYQRAKIDIFIHKNKGPKTCWFSYSKEKDSKLKYCVSKFKLKEVDFLGIKVNVPDPAKKYLEEHYGKDWRIPKSNGALGDYNYSSSPISLVNTDDDW